MKGQRGYIAPEAVIVYSRECQPIEIVSIDHKSYCYAYNTDIDNIIIPKLVFIQ